jgi:peptidoglycan/LPS O-acetylase OafA/YrhL
MGWFGVDVFFILSGFVLTWQVLHEAGSRQPFVAGNFARDYGRFIYRRIARVYPAYYACLAVLLVLAWLHVYGEPPELADVALHLVMFHNLVDKYVSTICGVFWSLPFEWQFYLLFPVLVLFVIRERSVWLLLLGIAVSAATKLLVLWGGPTGQTTSLLQHLPVRLDAFVVGMVAAKVAFVWPTRRWRRALSFWVGAVALLGAAEYYGLRRILWWSWDAVPFIRAYWVDGAVALLLIGLSGERHIGCSLFSNRPMVWFGTISYSIYLWHLPILQLLVKLRTAILGVDAAPASFFELLVVGTPLVLLVSSGSYYLIERPWLRGAGRQKVVKKSSLAYSRPILILVAWGFVLLGLSLLVSVV